MSSRPGHISRMQNSEIGCRALKPHGSACYAGYMLKQQHPTPANNSQLTVLKHTQHDGSNNIECCYPTALHGPYATIPIKSTKRITESLHNRFYKWGTLFQFFLDWVCIASEMQTHTFSYLYYYPFSFPRIPSFLFTQDLNVLDFECLSHFTDNLSFN